VTHAREGLRANLLDWRIHFVSQNTGRNMNADQNQQKNEAWFTLSGDVNSDMVHRVFEAVAAMTADGIDTAHVLVQSNGGYVSDGLCLYNFMANSPVEFVMYNGGAVACDCGHRVPGRRPPLLQRYRPLHGP
jgi:ATP-dependent protease ClpP protease subunit